MHLCGLGAAGLRRSPGRRARRWARDVRRAGSPATTPGSWTLLSFSRLRLLLEGSFTGMIFPVTLLSPDVSEMLRNWRRACQRAARGAVAWTAVQGDGEGAALAPCDRGGLIWPWSMALGASVETRGLQHLTKSRPAWCWGCPQGALGRSLPRSLS